MNPGIAFIALGAGLMYLLDPDRGARRRGLVRDRMTSALHTAEDAVSTTARDVTNRAGGLAAEVRGRISAESVPDDVLAARVRAQLGRVVSHPRAIDTMVENGQVTLRGPVLAHEADRLCSTVARVRGVRELRDELTRHKTAEGVPALQGGRVRPGMRSAVLQENWSPTTRLVVGGAGGALAAYGVSLRTAAGNALAMAGVTAAIRGITNLEMRRLFGVGARRRAIEIDKTISVDAPREQVFAFWEQYENFPRFMTHVQEVRPTRSAGQSHWTIRLPGGVPLEFDAEITRRIPNELLAWRSVPGSTVQHAGMVRFDPNPDGSTRVQIRFSYNPPAGAIGHGLATLVGADARSLMDEDLVRMKTTIETGRPPHDAAQPGGPGASATPSPVSTGPSQM